MVQIESVGLGIPNHEVRQDEVRLLMNDLFPNNRRLKKLSSVFDNAMVATRQLVKNKNWYMNEHTFEEVNDIYMEYAIELSLKAMDNCLSSANTEISYKDIDGIIYISSSGMATPSIDAHILNERDFREDVTRIPIWGLGCMGGASGLSRGFDYLKAYPEKTVMVVCCELCSLTFQKVDHSMSNLVGTAIFGDGASAVLLTGPESLFYHPKKRRIQIIHTSSYTQKDSLDVMGWNITNNGFEVIFSKNIPKMVPVFWKQHLNHLLETAELTIDDLETIVAHPGGRKVLEAMEESAKLEPSMLKDSYDVLRDHGNMSSATVFYVLEKWVSRQVQRPQYKRHALLCALGPGFSSEIILLELIDE